MIQVQEFEHINGDYSMPEMIKKGIVVDTAKVSAAGSVSTGDTDTPKSTTTSTSATPATSAAASPAPNQPEATDKEKEVTTTNIQENMALEI